MLGKQAEACFTHALTQSKRYQVIASTLQIQGEVATLGEIDYLVYDRKRAQLCHIELACKFYLYDTTLETQESRWIGPNRKDTLAEKLQKLKQKQFPLLFASETERVFSSLDINTETVVQQLCLKAFLFLPKKTSVDEIPAMYRSCVVGYWIRPSQLFSKDASCLYALPKKKEWLLPPEMLPNWNTFEVVQHAIQQQLEIKRSPLVYRKTGDTIERFFVVWW